MAMSLESLQAVRWEDPVPYVNIRHGRESLRHYDTKPVPLPGSTTVIKAALGLSQQSLIRWSADEERKAMLAALAKFSEKYPGLTGPALATALESHIGPERKHQKILAAQGEIGTLVHETVHWYLRGEMGLEQGSAPELSASPAAAMAFVAWRDWWDGAGLIPLRAEQQVWCPEIGYAGTIDLLAVRESDGKVGVIDTKTSKGIYDDHHIQVASYCHAARKYVPIEWALIVKLPKQSDHPGFEVRELGQLYDRTLTEVELMESFMAALTVFKRHCVPL